MPIDIAFGTVTQDFDDVVVPGKVELVWDRRYSTAWLEEPIGPLGQGWTNRYFATLTFNDGRYEFVTPQGAREYFFDNAGTVEQGGTVRNLGAFLEIFREGEHCIIQSWDVDGGPVRRYRFAPRASGQKWPLLSIADISGRTIDLTWGADDRLRSVRQCHERRELLLDYSTDGRIQSVTLQGPSGRRHTVATYEYDAAGRMVAAIDAAGNAERYEYRTDGRLHREILKTGGVFLYRYDGKGRCVLRTGLDRYSEKRFKYLDSARVTEVTDSYDRKFVYQYLPTGQTVVEVGPLGARRLTAYDVHSRIVAKTDATGATVHYAYDELGNRTSVRNALGHEMTVEFDSNHQPQTLIDAKSYIWRRAYDVQGRLIGGADPLGRTWSFGYDLDGNLEEICNPKGDRKRFHYSNGILKSMSDWNGASTSLEFDDFGRVLCKRGPVGDVTSFQYDLMGNPVRVDLPDGGILTASFDQFGNLVHFIDAGGRETRWRYGPCGRLMERVDPVGNSMRYVWGTERNRLDKVINEKGETYTFFRDDGWNITREEGFDGSVRRFTYDAEGYTTVFNAADGATLTFERDPLHRVISQHLPDGELIKFEFDPLGDLVAAVNSSAAVRFERDEIGHIVREEQGDHWVASTYDVSGCLVRTQTSQGYDARYEVDANGFATVVNVNGKRMTFQRNAYGKETLRLMQGGMRSEQRYDAAGRLIDQRIYAPGHATPTGLSVLPSQPLVVRRSYAYDAAGVLTRVEDGRWGWTNFNYDPVEDLLGVLREHGASESFGYDACGNVTRWCSEAAESVDETLDYGPGNRLLRKGDTRYEHDAVGRRGKKVENAGSTQPKTWLYEWNAIDRLTRVTRPDGAVWTYRYDALGRRIEKRSDSGERIQYLWDRDLVIHEMIGDQLASTWVYHGADFKPLATEQGGKLYSVITDHLGTPQELVTEFGVVAWSNRTEAWGARLPSSEPNQAQLPRSAPNCPIGFQGQWADAETGLHYNRYRYYDPQCGAYISEDPLRLAAGLNLYRYGRSPINSADPMGLAPNPEYFPLDSQGRATGGFAEVNQSTLGSGTPARANATRDANMGFVSGEHPEHQQRSHLIANNHGGSGTDPRNVVAMTSGSNHPGMRTHEDTITAHVREGNTVLVEVTAHYVGDSRVPDHVRIYAIDQHGNVIVDERVANGQLQDHKACGCS